MTDLKPLLAVTIDAVEAAGQTLLQRFAADARPGSLSALLSAIDANDASVETGLRSALLAARPGSQWVDDEEDGGALPAGEWWVADPAEGNVNHIHGGRGWGVTATLVRDGLPVLTVVHLPLSGDTGWAILGQGAFLNGNPLKASLKTELGAAIVGTGQGKPGEDHETYARIGHSVTAMLAEALLVRMSVPATLELLDVAAGRLDGFWQFSQVRSGLVCGALLVAEAGGHVTDMQGWPWTLESTDFLATAPGIHTQAVRILSA